MQLKHDNCWFSGKGQYVFQIAKDANIIDAHIDTSSLTISYLVKDPFLHLKERKFLCIPTWDQQSDLSPHGELAYIGSANWPVPPTPDGSLEIPDLHGGEKVVVSGYKAGTIAQMTFEHYLIFEVVEDAYPA